MIQYKDEDILKCTENIIVQSVNHQKRMGSGLAKQIAQKFPEILNDKDSYMSMCTVVPFQIIKRRGLVAWYFENDKYVASVFGQEYYGYDGKQYTDYVALGNGLESVKEFAKENNLSIAIPYQIGCGLGGGNWLVVEDIIKRCFYPYPNLKVTIYKKD